MARFPNGEVSVENPQNASAHGVHRYAEAETSMGVRTRGRRNAGSRGAGVAPPPPHLRLAEQPQLRRERIVAGWRPVEHFWRQVTKLGIELDDRGGVSKRLA